MSLPLGTVTVAAERLRCSLHAAVACATATVEIERGTAAKIFGFPDALKLRSCATLFACVSPPGSVFERLLEKYYRGARDERTLQILGVEAKDSPRD